MANGRVIVAFFNGKIDPAVVGQSVDHWGVKIARNMRALRVRQHEQHMRFRFDASVDGVHQAQQALRIILISKTRNFRSNGFFVLPLQQANSVVIDVTEHRQSGEKKEKQIKCRKAKS